jgi:diguanylate cyclase (GGDEF)-like protein
MIDEPVSHCMNRRVLTGEADTPIREVVRRLANENQSAFVVCEDATPVGVITERDTALLLARVLDGHDVGSTTAADVMASPVHSLPESAPMFEVVRIMKERGFRRVPIVDDKNRLSGIVNLEDLQNATNAALASRKRDLEAAVSARTAELQVANARLQELTREDSLTGLLNRRAMGERVAERHALARRHGSGYSVILLDIDHFKLYNDSRGHLAGDEVIRSVATCLKEATRGSDSVFRYGGEEFLVLLPECDADGAACIADRIRSIVAAKGIDHPASPTARHVTVSMGFTEVTTEETATRLSWQEVVDQADRALYRAKQSGRDRAERFVADPSPA